MKPGRASLGICIRLSAVLLFLSPVQAAPPEMPLAMRRAIELLSEIEKPRMLYELCAARSPDSAAKNTEVHAAWQKKHAEALKSANDLLMQYEEKLVPLMSAFSEGNLTSIQLARELAAAQIKVAADARSATYLARMCETYPDFVAAFDKDFEDRLYFRMQSLKAAFDEPSVTGSTPQGH